MYYILKNKKVERIDDILIWGKWMQKGDRIIKQEHIENYFVSTVFLGLNYDISNDGPPLIFETMIFNEEEDNKDVFQERCRSYEDAIEQHKQAVKYIKNKINEERNSRSK